MRYLAIALLCTSSALYLSSAAGARAHSDLPSCNLTEQHELSGDIGGTIRDAQHAHISMRVNILQADISTARKAGSLSEQQASKLWHRAQKIATQANELATRQGFLSAAEQASQDRELDSIAQKMCR